MTSEDLELKYAKYHENLKCVFSDLCLSESADKNKVKEIIKLAEGYFKDAEYFKNMNMKVTSLISLAYSEGLLDALRILNHVVFEWRESKR